MADPFAAVRKREGGETSSYADGSEHAEHRETSAVFAEKRQFSAVAHQEHLAHREEPAGLRMRDLAHLPTHWTEAMLAMTQARLPPDRCADRWRQAIRDAATFLLNWHDRADELGWSVGHVFGCEPGGAIGLALAINGGRVRDLFVDRQGCHAAHLQRGSLNEIVRRLPAADAPLVWLQADGEEGQWR